MVKKQQRRKRRVFTPEFTAEAVRLCKVGDRTIAQVAKDLDLTENSLREWRPHGPGRHKGGHMGRRCDRRRPCGAAGNRV
jgi:transposase-like protein